LQVRLILDTSVVVSAVRNPSGASRQLVNAAIRGELPILLSDPLCWEYESVLLRPEHLAVSTLSPLQIEELVLSLMGAAILVKLQQYLGPRSSDPGDNHVLSLAAFGEADAIVTFNTRHFVVPAKELGVNLYTPGEALRLWRTEYGDDAA